jgi:hypothetical protein
MTTNENLTKSEANVLAYVKLKNARLNAEAEAQRWSFWTNEAEDIEWYRANKIANLDDYHAFWEQTDRQESEKEARKNAYGY